MISPQNIKPNSVVLHGRMAERAYAQSSGRAMHERLRVEANGEVGFKKNRGQVAFTDATLSSLILIMITLVVLETMSIHTMQSEGKKTSLEAKELSDFLVFSEGYPLNWTRSSLSAPGIYCGIGEICLNKLTELNKTCGLTTNQGYSKIKKKYYYAIYYETSCICGCDLSLEKDNVARSERVMQSEGKISTISVYVLGTQ